MNKLVDSTSRGARDYFFFGVVFWGVILGAAGIIMVSVATDIVGAVMVATGIAYFVLRR